MTRDPRYDSLFAPLKLGPVTAPNRFYQVPHCSGMGYRRPQMMAAMRGMKAAGGWGVVCTEYCSIHPSSDDMPYPHAALWDDGDVDNLRLMTSAVHEHGALAGVELWYGGRSTANLYTRQPMMGPNSLPNTAMMGMPIQSQAMSRRQIKTLQEWHRRAAKRALEADFDIVYVYANHQYMLHDFLSSTVNTRRDEYGGNVLNRVRLLREIIEQTLETVAGRSAVAVRYSIPANFQQDPGEMLEMFSLLAELPDLWDITVDDYSLEMGSSRFVKEAANQAAVAKIKSLTSKPVVSVGRFTSPDMMLQQITSGVQDFIGAARPSIADPFLPAKIDQGRLEDIRECIGCNICYAHDTLGAPIRCTQNPTMGEEWRRGWHADKVAPKHAAQSVLVIGAGPAGLEAACTLGQRGYDVILAEAGTRLGGRVTLESHLPGLAEWARVRDWRIGQIQRMPNVSVFLDNRLDADAVLLLQVQHVIVATGSSWRRDGVGRWRHTPFSGYQLDSIVSPDQILAGELNPGKTIIYDDDHYYLGSAIALQLRRNDIEVTLVTPESAVASWSQFTNEQQQTLRTLDAAGVTMVRDRGLLSWDGASAKFQCSYSNRVETIDAKFLVPLTARLPNDTLWQELQGRDAEFKTSGGLTMQNIGDSCSPGLIASAVYSGHMAARELGLDEALKNKFARDTQVVKQ